ncbi:phage tail protein [Tumebacillus algifaecis]|uniref:Phage tail protein n=1 Tax=Tumebacillus algifaecis TaxID=1214604 RepID=A0A223CWW5_9BACL|nr:tail fiber protein [Tumebacillus algifaecis]ASS73707.1 phage tail protein [Tumebacillus algifaecis]
MSESYLGEIRMFAGNFAPQGWALCNGQLLSIAENEALFALLGTTYGGDGRTTFGLPNLQGRIPIHRSATHPLGEAAGSEKVTLLASNLPQHTHIPMGSTTVGTDASPINAVWGTTATTKLYSDATTTVSMSNQVLSAEGGNQPHDNMMPSTAISFIISLYGIFPPQP